MTSQIYIILLTEDNFAVDAAGGSTSSNNLGLPVIVDELFTSLNSMGAVYELLSSTVQVMGQTPSRRQLLSSSSSSSGGLPILIMRLDEKGAAFCSTNPNIESIEPDAVIKVAPIVHAAASFLPYQNAPSASLDRIDQRSLPLDGQFRFTADGAGVDVYVLDSGILASHQEFSGRVSSGGNFAEDRAQGDGGDYSDCSGHGTHVTSLLGGTTYGSAKRVLIHPVRVMKCDNEGTLAAALLGIDFVLRKAKEIPSRHFIVNLSWGGDKSGILDAGIARLLSAGGLVVAAAGNDDKDSCYISPAGTPGVISVASSSVSDTYSSFSNFGPCVSVVAPGEFVLGAGIKSPSDTATLSGTSMASPLTAGVAAIYWTLHPTESAATVRAAIICSSTFGAVTRLPNVQTTSRLIYSDPNGWTSLPEDCRAISSASSPSVSLSVIACLIVTLVWRFRRIA